MRGMQDDNGRCCLCAGASLQFGLQGRYEPLVSERDTIDRLCEILRDVLSKY